MNHILVRPKKTAPMEGSLADLTSLVGHQEASRLPREASTIFCPPEDNRFR